MQEFGDAGFVAATESTYPFRSDTPRTRWFDGQNAPLAGKADSLRQTDYFRDASDSSASGEMIELARWLVPAGHSLGLDRVIDLKVSSAYPTPSYAVPKLSDGSLISRMIPSSSMIDIEFDTATTTVTRGRAFRLEWQQGNSGALPDIGEVWWTNIYEPVIGTAWGWEDFSEAVANDIEMDSGAIFTNVRGDPRRQFTLEHIAASGSDLRVYDELRRSVGHGSGAFWYDHTDSADKVALVHALDVTGVLALSACTEQVSSGGAPDGTSDCLEIETDGLSVVTAASLASADWETDAPTDWRNMVLQFDFKPEVVTWLTAVDSLFLNIFDASLAFFTQYLLGQPFVNHSTGADLWHRYQIDLELDKRPNYAHLDMTHPAVVTLGISAAANSAARTFEICNLRLIDKTKQPVYVKVVPGSYGRQQTSNAPGGAGGPRYDIDMRIIEVTA
jgi:hypothetical protein